MKVFLDTNVLIDFMAERQGYPAAAALFQLADNKISLTNTLHNKVMCFGLFGRKFEKTFHVIQVKDFVYISIARLGTLFS